MMNNAVNILFFILAFATISLPAQDVANFPKAWEGKWKGQLDIFGPQGKVNEVEMELHILPSDSTDYTWTIIYGLDKEKGKRDYIIRLKDAKKAQFEVDERNSIYLDAYLLGGKLFERFEVMDNMLLATTEKVGDELWFEILSGSMLDPRSTGNTMQGEDEILEVKSYMVHVFQKAVLKRI
jgi:hypothetical protein